MGGGPGADEQREHSGWWLMDLAAGVLDVARSMLETAVSILTIF